MVFILGVLGFMQMTVIPGYLLFKLFHLPRTGRIQSIMTVFGLSLVFNYLAVYLLTVLGIYGAFTVYTLLAVEAGAIVYYLKKEGGLERSVTVDIKSWWNSLKNFAASHSLLYHILFLSAVVFIVLFFYYQLDRFREVFYLNDAVLSWNRWAIDWYHNRLPVNTWFYPQLISSNWSMVYQIMGTVDIQFITRNLMPLFSIGTLLLFIDLGLRKKQAVYFLGAIFYGLIMDYLFAPHFIVEGYVDIPVSFFAFLSFYILISNKYFVFDDQEPFLEQTLIKPVRDGLDLPKTFVKSACNRLDIPKTFGKSADGLELPKAFGNGTASAFDLKTCLLSITFASAAAVTKQGGLYILLFIVGWNILWMRRNRGTLSSKKMMKIAGVILLIIAGIVLSWYVNRVVYIMKGYEKAGIKTVIQDVHKNRTYLERFDYGFYRIMTAKGRNHYILPCMLVGLFFLLCSTFKRRIRVITWVVVVPQIILWGFFFSYDYRNLSVAIPFAALSMAFCPRCVGDNKSFSGGPGGGFSRKEPPGLPLWFLCLIFLCLLLVLNFTIFRQDRLIENQLVQQRKVGHEELNQKLYDYYEKYGFEGKVFSKYPFFQVLPVFREYWTRERTGDDVYYFLEDSLMTRKSIQKEIKQKLKSGEYRTIFRLNQYRFIKIRNNRGVEK